MLKEFVMSNYMEKNTVTENPVGAVTKPSLITDRLTKSIGSAPG